MGITPFANDSEAEERDGLSVENGTDRVTLYGRFSLTRDTAGLARARWLRDLAQAAVSRLESENGLPDQIAGPKPTGRMRNPFG